MPEQTTHTVMVDVTPGQFAFLTANSIVCRLVSHRDDHVGFVKEHSSIPRIVQAAILQVCETDEFEEEWSAADSVSMERLEEYDRVTVSNWPLEVQAHLIELSEDYVETHVETSAGNMVYTSIDFDDEGADLLFETYPQLREMFLEDPDTVATWFR